MNMQHCIIAHNIRSAHNVGAFFRTCDGLDVEKIYLSGYTPYPRLPDDPRPPHVAEKVDRRIHKTSLGAEHIVDFEHIDDIESLIAELKHGGVTIIGLEQTPQSIALSAFEPPKRWALLLGEEVEGIPEHLQALCDQFVEIPMHGQKESLNVSVATGIALYGLTT